MRHFPSDDVSRMSLPGSVGWAETGMPMTGFAGATMTEPTIGLIEDEIAVLIDYARRKYAEERYPLAPALRPVREALAKLNPQPAPEPLPPAKPYVPAAIEKKKRR
jgi:hypothetical protein